MAKPTPTSTSSRPVRRTSATSGRRAASAPASNVRWDIPLGRANMLILAAGIAVIIIGYLLMSTGIADDPLADHTTWNNASAVTIAPILLGLGYCVIVPFALLYRPKGGEVTRTDIVDGDD